MQHSRLLEHWLPAILDAGRDAPVLDLACGGGRNGIYLVNQGQAVVFADRRASVLDEIAGQLQGNPLASFWEVDLEEPGSDPLAGRQFSSILVFRYLHRPLMPAIKAAVRPGGLVLYETFTVDHAEFGRPTNPDFLLRPGELGETFAGWELLYRYEGFSLSETGGREQAIAQIVARQKER